MELYDSTCYKLAEQLTQRYSTSFSMSSRLFHASIGPRIYAIYGLVRIADEIVDTYTGSDKIEIIEGLLAETRRAVKTGYSYNPIVHAYALTAREYGIDDDLLLPFFDSMKMDIQPVSYDRNLYNKYIYGSAEVVGLMCLRVFVAGDEGAYRSLADDARTLGAAYQKVNFLRDIRADYEELGRMYFPGVSYETFSDMDKNLIVADIEKDFAKAESAIAKLPMEARNAVRASYYYYRALLGRLESVPAAEIAASRVRVPNWQKVGLLMRAGLGL